MKNILLSFCSALVLAALATSALAVPGGYATNGRYYLESYSDLSHWSAGLYSESRDRMATIDEGSYLFSSSEVAGYIGYDVLRWMTLYGLVGGVGYDLDEGNTASSSSTEFGLGIKFNLFDHEILDPTLIENRIRVNAGLQYAMSSMDWWDETLSMNELSGSLTVSLINDIEGNKLFLPNGIGIFGGGIYSDYIGSDVDADKKLGGTAGLQIFYTDKVTIELSAQLWEETTFMGGVHVRF